MDSSLSSADSDDEGIGDKNKKKKMKKLKKKKKRVRVSAPPVAPKVPEAALQRPNCLPLMGGSFAAPCKIQSNQKGLRLI